ncbi:MAG: phospholipase [Betaproteobacteria bacterium RIFCSPLOWO2_02_FULL_65_24]|nr:MAG: phospholipase [Betaproteobacteria bacterium RIFCSPLOWO2_02_FULL_65_24]OGA71919.1 MAG: phospholipase [Betaproteobacteria bacterium RIFCSPLOWO2_12_FULL_66_14]
MSQPRSAQSLFVPGANCATVARADRVALLVDGKAYFEAFVRAAEQAQRSIIILAWDFDSRTQLRIDDVPQTDHRKTATLGGFLNSLVRRRRRLHVRVLNWDYPVIFGRDREWPPLYGLSWHPHRRTHLRYDGTHPLAGSQHQKIVVIDDRLAFTGGLDLTCRRWDTPEHKPRDPRRCANGTLYPPFHDLMAAVDGEAARALSAIARKRWHAATGELLKPVSTSGDPWPAGMPVDLTDVDTAIACTWPAAVGRPEERHVERLYLDMIQRARRRIYIENQYFTSHRIGEALAARLTEPDGPEIVLVTRLLSHGWLEEMTMHVLRTGLVRDLRASDRHGHFHVYYAHIDGLEEGTCIDVHSKMMAVDDEWLRIGSANLSNRSMGMDTECDVVFEAGGSPRIASVIRGFRDRLLAEHVGVAPQDVSREIEARGSVHAAIEALGTPTRSLRSLEVQEWPSALVSAVAITDPERPVSLERLVAELTPEEELTAPSSGRLKLLAAVVVLVGLALTWRFTPLAEWITVERMTGMAKAFGQFTWAPLALVAAYLAATFTMFPRPLLTLASGVAFGPWLGLTYSMTGILIASWVTYFLGRRMKRDMVRRIAGERLNRLSFVIKKRGLVAMVAIRLVPLAPFIVENIVAGAFRIKLVDYTLGTFIGMLPGAMTATVFGGQLENALTDPSRADYILMGTVLAILVAGALLVRRWLAKLEAAHHHPPAPEHRERSAKRVMERMRAAGS